MFQCVRRWWRFKADNQPAKLLKLLTKESIQNNQNKLFIKKPGDYFLERLSASEKTGKPVFSTIAENITNAQASGTLDMSKAQVTAVIQLLESKATPEQPNPFDAALASIVMPVHEIFKGLDVQQIMAISTIGEMTRTVVVDTLLDIFCATQG
jgi:hypothetical protein